MAETRGATAPVRGVQEAQAGRELVKKQPTQTSKKKEEVFHPVLEEERKIESHCA